MNKTTRIALLAGLIGAGLLGVATRGEAAVTEGVVDNHPGGAPPYAGILQNNGTLGRWVRFEAFSNNFGGSLNVTSNNGSYRTDIEVFCSDGTLNTLPAPVNGTNSLNGDLLFLCDNFAGSFGLYTWYWADSNAPG